MDVTIIAFYPIWLVGSALAVLVLDPKAVRILKVFRFDSVTVIGLAVTLFMIICGYMFGVFYLLQRA